MSTATDFSILQYVNKWANSCAALLHVKQTEIKINTDQEDPQTNPEQQEELNIKTHVNTVWVLCK